MMSAAAHKGEATANPRIAKDLCNENLFQPEDGSNHSANGGLPQEQK